MAINPTPPWSHCSYGADPAIDPVGCRGIHVPGHTACLAHLNDADRAAYLSGLTPGAHVDHRGTPFTPQLVNQLLGTLRDPATGNPHLGHAAFDEAWFSGEASFCEVKFSGIARFNRARFAADAYFNDAKFDQPAWFTEAHFSSNASFDTVQFSDRAWFNDVKFRGDTLFRATHFSCDAAFDNARFSGDAGFDGAQFSDGALFPSAHFYASAKFNRSQFVGNGIFIEARFFGEASFLTVKFSRNAFFHQAIFGADASFRMVQFCGNVNFTGVRFSGDARFNKARLDGVTSFGPILCAERVVLAGAVFGLPVTLAIASREVDCGRTRWDSTATIRVRYAAVNLREAVLSAPVAVTAHPAPFTSNSPMDESPLTGSAKVRVISLQGVDAAHLVLTDTDLSYCLFSGAFHLDQLRLEGNTTLAPTPAGWHQRGLWPAHWTRRRTLAEEHHWRAQASNQTALPAGADPQPHHWRPGPHHPDPAFTTDPDDVAALYRQLRKAFGDGKNEPGAADFYYGECEMRRHAPGTPTGERQLLWAYWLLSGYGLRASRALVWLAAAMLITVMLMMGFGLPEGSLEQRATGTVPSGGGRVTFEIEKDDPQDPTGKRITVERFEKSLNITLNSVVFRSSGQELTTAGSYIEMTSRFFEPALLALAVLAVRGRVKR
ncbi:pentapeptide repeat-containing protein [Streptomyces sp. NPDC059466]|uniref:pentapeptide repeat-containing protein n=1 Tax=unclassified Streptomyces TaxID=2593676 RepID=UPI0036AF3925